MARSFMDLVRSTQMVDALCSVSVSPIEGETSPESTCILVHNIVRSAANGDQTIADAVINNQKDPPLHIVERLSRFGSNHGF